MTDFRIPALDALADRYEISGEIGRGGMATVYRALDKRHGSDVAIKVLRRELIVALGGERFSREVRVTAGLQHPNILPLLDSGEADGVPFYVMPLVLGGSLERELQRDGPLPIHDAIRYVAEIAEGLAYAHGLGLIHRDIKPANILLSHGHALLADFGVARVLDTAGKDALTDSGLALGTASYMSPEQAAGERVDARADIYALGCVLYELLTGSPPFAGSNHRAIMARHAVDPVPSVRTVREGVTRAVEAVVARALAKTPADRFRDVGEFRVALLAAASSADADVLSTRRTTRGLPWLIGGGAVAAALLAAFLLHRPATAEQLNPNRVMVYPLVLPADWTGSRTAGEDVSTMIGSAMDGAGSLRWLDGWQLLSPARRNDIRTLADSEANALARRNHSRYVVTGRIAMRSGDSAEVILSLRDLATDSLVAWPSAASLAKEPWRASLHAVTKMLPALIPSGDVTVMRDWSDRDPQAIAHFLAGEAALRRVHLGDALAQFKAAVEVDTSFGFAALRGAQVASWAHQPGAASSLVRVAIAHARSPRERAFAAGLAAFLDGRSDSSVALLKTALALDPGMAVAWMQLSETYFHLLPESGSTDSLASDALGRAIALDSTATHLLFHEVELAARSGASLRADSLARRFLAVASDTMLRGEVALMAACAKGQWSSSSARDAAAHRPQPLSIASKAVGLSRPQCMRDGYSAILAVDTAASGAAEGRRWFALMGLHQLLLARGATDSAAAAIDRFQARWNQGTSLYLVDAPVVPAFAPRARRVAADDSAKFGVHYHSLPYTSRLWLLGTWAATDGKIETAQAVATDLRERAAKSGLQADSAMFESLETHLVLARGDTARAIALLTALLHRAVPFRSVPWEESASFGLERLTLGRLLMAQRRFAEARGVLEVLDSAQPASFPLYAPAATRLRADAAAALGDLAQASALRKRASSPSS